MEPNKCVFLDRDGVINAERGGYTYLLKDFQVIDGVREALSELKKHGFYLMVVTNQAGISRGMFTTSQMNACHAYMNEQTGHMIDEVYYSPWHPAVSESLARKPDTLMFERGLAKYNIDPFRSWMVGNSERDLLPAKEFGIRTIFIGIEESGIKADYYCDSLLQASRFILESS